ncbi:MAG: hypothetical protein EOR99_35070 [Mesorhizobium sp.]|nr:MAG: hypothetical protein EOR99_35070 [Mesorhizobium sp.]
MTDDGWIKYTGQALPFDETARFDIRWADGTIHEGASGWEWDILMPECHGDPAAEAYRLLPSCNILSLNDFPRKAHS